MLFIFVDNIKQDINIKYDLKLMLKTIISIRCIWESVLFQVFAQISLYIFAHKKTKT